MRQAKLTRKTKETEISVDICLDGTGKSDIKTGIGFFDHMLTSLAKHALLDLTIQAKGDLEVDTHHTVEDVGIVLGDAILKALGNKEGINRYASFTMPMDESLVSCSIDFSGRSYFEMNYTFSCERVGKFETETVEEFFRALAQHGELTLHFQILRGKNAHHIIEAMFKSFAKVVRDAITINPRIHGVFSTKDVL